MKKREVCGFGINDAEYQTHKSTKNGRKYQRCPFYVRWSDMIKRCYYQKHLNRNPTYVGCSVCEEWRLFSNFKKWMEQQDWKGKQLDKDILLKGNKIYSPKTCIFVTQDVNKLLGDCGRARGDLPQGVHACKQCKSKKFRARFRRGKGTVVHLGYFKTSEEASEVYLKAKQDYILEIAENLKDEDPRLKPALIRIAENLTD